MTGKNVSRIRSGYSTVITKRRKGRNSITHRNTSQAGKASSPTTGLFRPPATYNFLFGNEVSDEEKRYQNDCPSTPPINPLNRTTTHGSDPQITIREQNESAQGFSLKSSNSFHTSMVSCLPSNETVTPTLESRTNIPSFSTQLEADNDERFSKADSWAVGPAALGDKGFSTSLKSVERCGEALGRFLARYSGHHRAVEEYKEYERCSAKVNQGFSLKSAEKSRLNQIVRNIERREYRLEADAANVLLKRRTPVFEPKLANATHNMTAMSVERNTDTEQPVDNMMVEQSADSESVNDERDCNFGISSEVAEEAEIECGDVSEEDDQGDDQGDHQDGSYWQYNVYMTDTEESTEPMMLTMYLSRAKAEARVRKEIIRALNESKLEDRTDVETRCHFSNGEVRGQSLEFASGRIVRVQIEREMLNGPLPQKQWKRLEQFPTKFYIINEDIVPLTSKNSSVSIENNDCTQAFRRTQGREAFVLLKHANEQASQEFLAYVTNHLSEEQKGDMKVIGNIDIEEGLYLHQLEEAERLYDRKKVLVDKAGRRFQVSVRVSEILVRGPRN